jgi:hypothetical protein
MNADLVAVKTKCIEVDNKQALASYDSEKGNNLNSAMNNDEH